MKAAANRSAIRGLQPLLILHYYASLGLIIFEHYNSLFQVSECTSPPIYDISVQHNWHRTFWCNIIGAEKNLSTLLLCLALILKKIRMQS